MLAILKKELNTIFTSLTGIGVIGLFLLFNGLSLWVLKSNWNLFYIGFADLQGFFELTPWLMIVLIPALTMRSFSDEFNLGTIELLKSKPLKPSDVVIGKYLAISIIISISILMTTIYAFSLKQLTLPNPIDFGRLIGSYLGLWLLSITFTAVAIWSSIFTKNQLLGFLLGIITLVTMYFLPEQLALWYYDFPNLIRQLSLYEHYKSISRGVIDSRDIIYFLSVISLFLSLTIYKYKHL